MPYSWENPTKLASLQQLVKVAKEFFFAFITVTEGCKEANLMGFSHYIYQNELTSENTYLPMNLANKSQFHFSFFKVYSQNRKFNL